jgi:hypothetical protein
VILIQIFSEVKFNIYTDIYDLNIKETSKTAGSLKTKKN